MQEANLDQKSYLPKTCGRLFYKHISVNLCKNRSKNAKYEMRHFFKIDHLAKAIAYAILIRLRAVQFFLNSAEKS